MNKSRIKSLQQYVRLFLSFSVGLAILVTLNVVGFWIIQYTSGDASLLPVGKTSLGMTLIDYFNPVLALVAVLGGFCLVIVAALIYFVFQLIMFIGALVLGNPSSKTSNTIVKEN